MNSSGFRAPKPGATDRGDPVIGDRPPGTRDHRNGLGRPGKVTLVPNWTRSTARRFPSARPGVWICAPITGKARATSATGLPLGRGTRRRGPTDRRRVPSGNHPRRIVASHRMEHGRQAARENGLGERSYLRGRRGWWVRGRRAERQLAGWRRRMTAPENFFGSSICWGSAT